MSVNMCWLRQSSAIEICRHFFVQASRFLVPLISLSPSLPAPTTVSQIVDKIADELDDDLRKVDEASLENVKVTISPALSPRGETLQRQVHVD